MLILNHYNRDNYDAKKAIRHAYINNRHFLYDGFYRKGYIEIRNDFNNNRITAYYRKNFRVHKDTMMILPIADLELWVAPEIPVY